jgi:hypothetical protein
VSRFYFHLWLGDRYERDEIGLECCEAEEAYIQAFHAAQDGWVEAVRARSDPRRYRFDVADAAGTVIFEVPFVEVIDTPKRVGRFLPIARTTERNVALVAEISRQIAQAGANLEQSRQLIARLEAIPADRGFASR